MASRASPSWTLSLRCCRRVVEQQMRRLVLLKVIDSVVVELQARFPVLLKVIDFVVVELQARCGTGSGLK